MPAQASTSRGGGPGGETQTQTQKQKKTTKPPVGHALLAGGVAGLVESSICHPLDTIKTRMQLRNHHVATVATRIQHSLVEPAVLRIQHSLVEPAVLRIKHSLVEPAVLRIQHSLAEPALDRPPKHSLVEPANLIRPRLRAASALRNAQVPIPAPSGAASGGWWRNLPGGTGRTPHPSAAAASAVANSKANSNGTGAWWNQRGQRIHATLAGPSDTRSVVHERGKPLGFFPTARRIVRREGFLSLYKGLTAVYVGIVPKMAIRFVSFEQYRETMHQRLSLGEKTANFAAGLLSGLTEAVLVVTPAEVCKIRMQSQRHSLLDPLEAQAEKYGNVLRTAATIAREEGWSALYKGVVPTMLRQGCNQAVNFTAYNAMKAHWLERKDAGGETRGQEDAPRLSGTMSLLIGGASGAMGPLVNNPLDVVKTRLQKQNTAAKNQRNPPRYTGLVQACLKISSEEGAGALWKGITPRLMRIVPGQAITFTTYEAVCRWLAPP